MYQPGEKEFAMKRIVAAIACLLIAGTALAECKTVYINGIANTVCDSNPPVAAPVLAEDAACPAIQPIVAVE